MAFPWVFESTFETGDFSEWDGGETDTVNQLDVAHYSQLAQLPWSTAAPFSGAYCLRAVLSGGTADATVLDGDIDIAANTTNYFKFNMWFDPDFTASADDTVNIFEAQQTDNTVEATFGFRYVASTDVINFGIGETAPTNFGGVEVRRGVWYTIELVIDIDNNGGNDGTIDLFVTADGEPRATTVDATQITGLDQGAVGQGVLGIQDHLATTLGTILFDNFIQDDAQIYPLRERFDLTQILTISGHAFIGPGSINDIQLWAGAATDNILEIYDTDNGNVTDYNNVVSVLRNTANNETIFSKTPVDVNRGAYIRLTGTNPRALIEIGKVATFGSVAAMRNRGIRRTAPL